MMKRHLDKLILILFLLAGALLSYIDNRLHFETILVEVVHSLVVTGVLIFCYICQIRTPEIKQFGWHKILLGLLFLTIGSWVDIADDPPVVALLNEWGIPFGRTWQQAFIKKILGYTVGFGLVAYGFFQWIPWMIESRLRVQSLNEKLSETNQDMNRLIMQLDDRLESERLNISRELHDVLAQQLTFLSFQIQLCRKEMGQSLEKARNTLDGIGQEITEALRNVRQICRDLRTDPLYTLGMISALEQFIEKISPQFPEVTIHLHEAMLPDETEHKRIEDRLNDLELLHLLRILQEGIRNALKHSRCQNITVSVFETTDRFRFVIEDDGVGLPWQTMPSDAILVQQGHLGIAGMKERVEVLSGRMSLKPRTPQGACLEVVFSK